MPPWPTITITEPRSRRISARATSSSRGSGRGNRPSSRRRGKGMPRTIRFHLDENTTGAVADGLRRLGIDVTTTSEAALLGAADEDQLAYARGEGRMLLTHDKDLLRLHAAGVPHAGIAYCRKYAMAIGEIVQGLVLIWEIYDPPRWRTASNTSDAPSAPG